MRTEGRYTIIEFPRAELVKIAEDLVNRYIDCQSQSPPLYAKKYIEDKILYNAVIDVARTADYVSVDWAADLELGPCGCLVGTARMSRGLGSVGVSAAELDIGAAFLETICDFAITGLLGDDITDVINVGDIVLEIK